MPLFHLTKPRIAAVAAAILTVGAITGVVNYRLERSHLRHDLEQEAEMLAAAFEPTDLHPLGAVRTDLASPEYLAIKRRLQKLQSADARIRYIGLYRAERSGPVAFLVDGTAAGSRDQPQPGDLDTPRSPAVQAMLQSGRPACTDPLGENSGASVTGVAPIATGLNPVTPGFDFLAINVTADDWVRNLWLAAFRGAFYAWTLLGFPFVALLVTRRQGEQQEAIRNLSEAVEQSHSAIMILDLEQRIEYANRGLCQQIGYSRRELIGRHCREFFINRSNDATSSDMLVTIRAGGTWEGEWSNQRKDGTTYPVHGMVTPVRHRDGSMACFVAMFDDVTEAKRKEAELRDARDLAQAGDRAKGQFLATMSHEVRTPLNGIVGFTSLLLETPLSTEQREYVHTIRASGEALIHLTGDILDYARIESGKLKLDPIACDPRECIEEALDLHATKAVEKEIELLHGTAGDVPAAVIVDGGRLRQVLVNLVGNAVKFTEHGEVEVSIRVVRFESAPEAAAPVDPRGRADQPCAVLEFQVRDTGIGISAAQHDRLFKPFSQIDESSTRRFGGAGLGLAICRNLVHLMGGEISVTSEPGRGSTFSFTIRVPVASQEPPRRRLDGLAIALAMPPGSARRELVKLLAYWGAQVREADTPSSVPETGWDLAIIDVDEAAARALAAQPPSTPALPTDKTLALVPISLSSESRTALRKHFRLLVNRPVHHGTFFALLSGSRPSVPLSDGAGATRFGFHVLVVEDNEVNQRLMQRVLTGFGCTCRVVGNGRSAIEELSQQARSYDVVLLDLHMPEMDGLAALERIRAGEAGDDARRSWIIALTADVRPEQKARGFAAGLDDYLTKPLRVAELESAFRRYRSERLTRKRQ
ncbi:MAG TPA: ATP-binding protein [Opitutaceae bacterium]|nr:ATP-binding protein [Opitutaceae bacterium]